MSLRRFQEIAIAQHDQVVLLEEYLSDGSTAYSVKLVTDSDSVIIDCTDYDAAMELFELLSKSSYNID